MITASPSCEVVAELGQHRGHGFGDGAQVLGDGLGLRHHLAVGGAQRGREIHHVLDDLRAGDAHHRVGHVVGDRIEPALDDGEGDGIDVHAGLELEDDVADGIAVHAGVGRHDGGGVELLDHQRAAAGRGRQRGARHDLGVDGGRAAREVDGARAVGRRAGARLDRQLLEVEPPLAQAAADHAQLHQLDRALVLVAVGLDVFGDEARRPSRPDRRRRSARSARWPGPRGAGRPPRRAPTRAPVKPSAASRRVTSAASRCFICSSSARVSASRRRVTVSSAMCSRSEASMPTALNTPASGGTTTRRMPRSRATSSAWMPPLPPMAISVRSRGSRPRSTVTARIARDMAALATARMPCAASSQREAERLGHVGQDRLLAQAPVDGEPAAGQRARVDQAQHDVGVRHGRPVVAEAVAGGTRHGAGRLRARP